MWYVLEDTVPKNVTEANSRLTKIRTGPGVLHTIYAQIPAGTEGLARFRLWHESYCILPRNESKSITGDGVLIDFREGYVMKAAENTLTLETWNDDEIHQHTITLLVGVLPEWFVAPTMTLQRVVSEFMRMFRRRE